jgi:predicted tellurium resistance membrane protein TerC
MVVAGTPKAIAETVPALFAISRNPIFLVLALVAALGALLKVYLALGRIVTL